jgi:hypothetical protein
LEKHSFFTFRADSGSAEKCRYLYRIREREGSWDGPVREINPFQGLLEKGVMFLGVGPKRG